MFVRNPFQLNESTNRYSVCRAVTADELIEAARAVLEERFAPGTAVTSTETARNCLMLRFGELEHEVFACLFLDNRHRLIALEEMFRGTIDGASVYPREVVKAALRHNAAAVILAHNHPSGVPDPSQADIRLTERLRDALALIDIRILDHVIVAGDRTTSFAERGLL